eukprot:CAMPEP_0195043248 /NCGR_PEP_ID=MMETSP0347-20130606/3990_1 /TAXON_ID=2932 /ORGANISM="Alexandrium fundyense, Strain CCMP1719" /LENGTH=63 /DNA_ID=CAMNT_0040070631 /DNA_START=70 /DNA_END=258 /DNA_ORIENTATION=+
MRLLTLYPILGDPFRCLWCTFAAKLPLEAANTSRPPTSKNVDLASLAAQRCTCQGQPSKGPPK